MPVLLPHPQPNEANTEHTRRKNRVKGYLCLLRAGRINGKSEPRTALVLQVGGHQQRIVRRKDLDPWKQSRRTTPSTVALHSSLSLFRLLHFGTRSSTLSWATLGRRIRRADIWFLFSDISYKEHTVFIFHGLFHLTLCSYCSIHFVANGTISFFFWLNSTPLCISSIFSSPFIRC